MKLLLTLLIILISFAEITPDLSVQKHTSICKADSSLFNLDFIRLGFGLNRDELQPMFQVKDHFFVYSSEYTWLPDNERKQEAEIICSGPFLRSSADSVMQILSKLKTNKIYVSRHYSSGCQDGLSISKGNDQFSFVMFNTSDSTAQLIVNILNNYIPPDKRKIYLMN